MAFHPAPACHVTPPTTKIKTNCLERVETERLEPWQTNSAVSRGRLGLCFGLLFPERFCDFHFSSSCGMGRTFLIPALSQLSFGVAPLGRISSPSQPCSIHLPIPGTPNPTESLRKPNSKSPEPLPAPQTGCQTPGRGRVGSENHRQHQLHTGMVCPALPCQLWGRNAGMRGRADDARPCVSSKPHRGGLGAAGCTLLSQRDGRGGG